MKSKEIQEKDKINVQLQNKKKVQKLKEKGITLIALVVTIIILLILAGVTLNMALSGDGLFNMARKAATDYNEKSVEEKLQILYTEKIMEDIDNNSNVKTDVTSVLEEMVGGEITEENIEEFNKLLKQYNEEVKGITTAEELAKIGQDEEYPIDGVYVQLSDIEEKLTTQIGSKDKPFKGIYNGNGKSIKKLSLTAKEDNTGMFRVNEGTVKNVTIEDCQITSEKGMVGGIAGENRGLIENCIISKGEIKSNRIWQPDKGVGVSSGSYIGGVCGENSLGGIIKNCDNSAVISGLSYEVGGICGSDYGGKLSNCENFGEIKGPYRIGGIAGFTGSEADKSVVEGCKNYGKIEAYGEENVYGDRDCACGGIVGYMNVGSVISICENYGEIRGVRRTTGGIAGLVNSNSVIWKSVNKGHIAGKKAVGRDCWCFGQLRQN